MIQPSCQTAKHLSSRWISPNSFLQEIYAQDSDSDKNLRSEYAAHVYQQKESDVENNSYKVEKLILTLVENGDTKGMRHFISNVPPYHAGIVANDVLRIQKNYFISTYTLTTRAAIKAGLPTSAHSSFRISISAGLRL